MKNEDGVIASIRRLGKQILPDDAVLILYGSRARGDAGAESDWDLLVVLKDAANSFKERFDKYGYPFVGLGWEYGEYISPKIYTNDEWEQRKATPFYNNVMREGIVLC